MAKTKGAYVELQRQFAKRLIKKTYAALVEGCVPQEQGCIDLDVDHKHAVSDWKVVARCVCHMATGACQRVLVGMRVVHVLSVAARCAVDAGANVAA